MKYVFLTYNFSLNFDSPQSWFKRTECYGGILSCLSNNNIVVNIKQINYEGECIHNGVQYHFVNFGEKEPYFPLRLHRYVKNLQPDIVVVQGLHNPLQLIQLGMYLTSHTKIIVHNHAEKPFNGIRRYLQKVADKYVAAYLFASRSMGLDWVKKGNLASAGKIHEVMEVSSNFHPINKEVAKTKTRAGGFPVFLWVGRLNYNKDPITVVKTFLKFAKTNADARLYMIYHTADLLFEITRLLNTDQNKNAVILLGKVEHGALLYWYNSADFFISGSHYEGSGTAVCEAMSCGCVPIVTDIFSFRMITHNGNCGLLYEAGNQGALLGALMQTSQLNIEEKRNRSLEYFKTNLSFEAIARKIEQVAASL